MCAARGKSVLNTAVYTSRYTPLKFQEIIFQIAILNSIRPDIGDIQALPPTNTDSSHGSDSDTKNPNREGKGYK